MTVDTQDRGVPFRRDATRLLRARLSPSGDFSAEVWRDYTSSSAQTRVVIQDRSGTAVLDDEVGDHPGCIVKWSPARDELVYTTMIGDLLEARVAQQATGVFSAQRVSTESLRLASPDIAWSPAGDELLAIVHATGPYDPTAPVHVTRRLWRHEGVGLTDRHTGALARIGPGSQARVLDQHGESGVLSHARWSPDHSKIAYIASLTNSQAMEPRDSVRVRDQESGVVTELIGPDWGWVTNYVWSDDSQSLFVLGVPADSNNHFANPMSLWRIGIDGSQLDLDVPGAGSRLLSDTEAFWPELSSTLLTVDDVVLFTREQRGRTSVWWVDQSDPARRGKLVTGADLSVALLDATRHAGRTELLTMTSSLGREFELHREVVADIRTRVTVSRQEREFQVQELRIPVTVAHEIHTFVALPSRGQAPYPAVLRIHGGPYASTGDVAMDDVSALVESGIAVVLHNFSGSYGYGLEFAQRISADWGRIGEVDHTGVINHLVKEGLIDRDKLGVMGLSHGGFATLWMICRSQLFRAAVAENGISNFLSVSRSSDIGEWYVDEMFSADEESRVQDLLARSPITYADDCFTPLLLMQGELDVRSPPEQADQMYGELKRLGRTVEMLRFPLGNHLGNHSGSHGYRSARLQHLIAWMRRYLEASDS